MTTSEFGEKFTSFTKSAFRLETLDRYTVDEEADSFQDFLNGSLVAPAADPGWMDILSAAKAAGKKIHRVHVLPEKLTPYLRFEIEWGYAQTASAGEEVHLLQTSDPTQTFGDLPFEDFWLFDDETIFRMVYDKDGRFLEPQHVEGHGEIERYQRARDIALQQAQTLQDWLSQYRQR